MLDDFALRALAAGFGIALVAGPLGCFIVWRHMAYFGDTLSHAALTGVAIGIVLAIVAAIGIIITGVIVGLLLLGLQQQQRLPTDTLLGILSHGALAIGLIVVGFLDKVRVDLMGYLFGDILAVTSGDLYWIYAGAALAIAGLVLIWRPLIALTVHESVAIAEGVPGFRTRLIFTTLIALTVAIAMKIVGILLVTALLVVPAATARRFASGPEMMALASVAVGALAVLGGVSASLAWDAPSGASIVAAATLMFALITAAGGVANALGPRNR